MSFHICHFMYVIWWFHFFLLFFKKRNEITKNSFSFENITDLIRDVFCLVFFREMRPRQSKQEICRLWTKNSISSSVSLQEAALDCEINNNRNVTYFSWSSLFVVLNNSPPPVSLFGPLTECFFRPANFHVRRNVPATDIVRIICFYSFCFTFPDFQKRNVWRLSCGYS